MEESVYQLMLSNIREAVGVLSENGEILWLNEAAEKASGWQLEQVRGKSAYEIFEVLPETAHQLKHDLQGRAEINVELMLRDRKGRLCWQEVQIIRYQNHFIAFSRLFSRRQRAYIDALEAGMGLLVTDDRGDVVYFEWKIQKDWPIKLVGRNVLKVFGYNPDHLKNRSFIELIHPDDLLRVQEEVRHYIQNRAKWFDQRYRIKDGWGNWRMVRDRTRLVWVNRTLVRVCGYLIDKTTFSSLDLETLINKLPTSVMAIGVSGEHCKYLSCNEEFVKIVGVSKAEIIGKPVGAFYTQNVSGYLQAINRAIANPQEKIVFSAKKPGGAEIVLCLSFLENDGEQDIVLCSGQEVAHVREAQIERFTRFLPFNSRAAQVSRIVLFWLWGTYAGKIAVAAIGVGVGIAAGSLDPWLENWPFLSYLWNLFKENLRQYF